MVIRSSGPPMAESTAGAEWDAQHVPLSFAMDRFDPRALRGLGQKASYGPTGLCIVDGVMSWPALMLHVRSRHVQRVAIWSPRTDAASLALESQAFECFCRCSERAHSNCHAA